MISESSSPAGAPEWIITFGDLMSLLLCFFVLLYAMSVTRSRAEVSPEMEAFMAALRERFGPNFKIPTTSRGAFLLEPQPHDTSGTGALREGETPPDSRATETAKGLAPNLVWIAKRGEKPILGVVLNFPDYSTELTPAHVEQLRMAAQVLRGKGNKLEVRGHSVGVRPSRGTSYRDDFDLGYSRAYKVMQHLVKFEQIERDRMVLVTVGRNEPAAAGDPATSARNSRVELYLLAELAEAPGSSGAP